MTDFYIMSRDEYSATEAAELLKASGIQARPLHKTSCDFPALGRQYTGRKVYIVDDQAEIGKIIQEKMTAEGTSVAYFQDPAQALKCYNKDNPTAVFTDLSMPGMDGYMLIVGMHKKEKPLFRKKNGEA